jgi:hypothetical protein
MRRFLGLLHLLLLISSRNFYYSRHVWPSMPLARSRARRAPKTELDDLEAQIKALQWFDYADPSAEGFFAKDISLLSQDQSKQAQDQAA